MLTASFGGFESQSLFVDLECEGVVRGVVRRGVGGFICGFSWGAILRNAFVVIGKKKMIIDAHLDRIIVFIVVSMCMCDVCVMCVYR